MSSNTPEQYGLAEPLMLEKIDSLFACGVGELVALPQIVVVGDQSSGKSSVLEGLIDKPLPRDSGLCTRFATQIIFCRAAQEEVVVSIIPDQQAPPEHISRVKQWGKTASTLESDTFKEIMQEAHEVMGLSGSGDDGAEKSTFSNDVLRLEISGPTQEHLSVIDVPGIFKSTTKGVTTKADIDLVRNMVTGYMENPRSVMLAVVPANTDLATQEILELAAEADTHGDRTLGVLTKPDLVDRGAESSILDLVEGRTRQMQLGWHIIRNPGQKELKDASVIRGDLEATFFRSTAPWNGVEKEKVGIESLRLRIKDVLSSLVKKEFPKVQTEIKNRLATCQKKLRGLGAERNTPAQQTAYLIQLATKFQRLVSLSISATHGADHAFETTPALCIAPALMSRMKISSDEMAKYGATYAFSSDLTGTSAGDADSSVDDTGASEYNPDEHLGERPVEQTFETRREEDLDDLEDILYTKQSLSPPLRDRIEEWLLKVFQANRGFEMGTFNASILATVMKKQCSKWDDISLGLLSDAIVIVHRFISSALASICDDGNVRNALANNLSDQLHERYGFAMRCLGFLLQVEKSNTPLTLNHYFNDNLQRSRQENASGRVEEKAIETYPHGKVVQLEHALQPLRSMSNEQHIVEDIHDILKSYYKVCRKTFVDNVCRQSVIHYLLESDLSPLALFSPLYVSQLSAHVLESIAGEDPALKRQRARLTKEEASLAEAVKVLAKI
ncbi:hypothetical protein CKM354_000609600 [Cercospora kikuchii]|uniref:Uncharacterized protein n=1 Tax=Cercospora kikuchii TaxID=84275 RepID=A0A9P3FD25_9PEZI|nr:uncharacterized protein CKM354_000609600 [Cercospora kikuchii]GIZ42843.1 hypothetical protein CKM354_000609600 [Cercospora kikuchii]